MAAANIGEVIEVFLLAENRFVREALGKLLSNKGGIRILGSAELSPETLDRVIQSKPHVLVTDSSVLNHDEPQVLCRIRAEAPGVRTLVIGMESDSEIFLRCVRAGIAGYLLKDASAAEIAAAVRSVAYEQAICPPRLCLALFQYFARQWAVPVPNSFGKIHLGLSRREQQLVHLISTGVSNKEIASQLNLSDQTVRNHVHRILRKLGASNRLHAVEICREQGLFV